MKINVIKCFCCDKDLDNWKYKVKDKRVEVHPMNGLAFRSYGHYGSTVFDPMNGTSIDIGICDDCIKSRRDKVYGDGKRNLSIVDN